MDAHGGLILQNGINYNCARGLPEEDGLPVFEFGNSGHGQSFGMDEDLIYSSAKRDVLVDLFRGIENPSYIRDRGNIHNIHNMFGSVQHLQRMFVISEYLGVPHSIKGSVLCQLLNLLNDTNDINRLEPRVWFMMRERLNHSVRDGILDIRNAGISNLDGLLTFFDQDCYDNKNDALDGSTVQAIDLSHNNISEIDFGRILKCFPNLSNLDLSHNDVRQWPHKKLPYNFSLDLSYNRLRLVTEFKNGSRLRVNCANNNFSAGEMMRLMNMDSNNPWRGWLRKITDLLHHIDPDAPNSQAHITAQVIGGVADIYSDIRWCWISKTPKIDRFLEMVMDSPNKLVASLNMLPKVQHFYQRLGVTGMPESIDFYVSLAKWIPLYIASSKLRFFLAPRFLLDFSVRGRIGLLRNDIVWPLFVNKAVTPVLSRIYPYVFSGIARWGLRPLARYFSRKEQETSFNANQIFVGGQ